MFGNKKIEIPENFVRTVGPIPVGYQLGDIVTLSALTNGTQKDIDKLIDKLSIKANELGYVGIANIRMTIPGRENYLVVYADGIYKQ